MKQIAMLVVESSSRISKAIQVGTMRPANHAAIGYVNDELVFEALFQGIEVSKSSTWYANHDAKTKIHKVTLAVDDKFYADSILSAWKHEKDEYNFKQLATFLPITRVILNKFIKDSELAWVCSEFAEYHARLAGINFIHKITKPSDVSPGDLLDSIRYEEGFYEVLLGPT